VSRASNLRRSGQRSRARCDRQTFDPFITTTNRNDPMFLRFFNTKKCMTRIAVLLALFSAQLFSAQINCNGGFAAGYPCNNINLMSRVDFPAMGGNANTEGSSCWGWTDPLDGREYALMGCSTHTAFVDITDPAN